MEFAAFKVNCFLRGMGPSRTMSVTRAPLEDRCKTDPRKIPRARGFVTSRAKSLILYVSLRPRAEPYRRRIPRSQDLVRFSLSRRASASDP